MGRRRLLSVFLPLLAVVFIGVTATAASGNKVSSAAPTSHLGKFSANASLFVTGGASSDASVFSFSGKSVFVAPSSEDCTTKGTVGGLQLSEHSIVIGKHVWSDDGSGFKKAKLADLSGEFICASNKAFWKSFPLGSRPSGLAGTSATVNGIKSTKYDLSGAVSSLTSTGVLAGVPSGATVTTFVVAYGGSNTWIDLFDLSYTGATATACSKMTQGALNLIPPCTFTIHVDIAKPNSGTLQVRAPSTK